MTAPDSGGNVTIVSAGPGLLVEDLGRPRWAHLGVPPSGALDPDALRLANRLVGNDPGAAGLEVLLGGLSMVVSRSARVAVAGADASIDVDGRPQPWGEPVSVSAGATLSVSAVRNGLRCWLAVDGGIAGPVVLGSAATDTLTGLGPEPVLAGARLPLGPRRPAGAPASAVPRPAIGQVATLRVRLGPRADWLTSDGPTALTATPYVVAPASDRVGVRLQSGDGSALERSRADELPSEGIVTGAVQVPSSGQPLIFLADHPVTGGYPVVAVVDRADLWRCAQLRPGDTVRFQLEPAESSPTRPAGSSAASSAAGSSSVSAVSSPAD
jgi:biotin-dependent carboxylase-like uncharacterized protein